jgi:polyphenol oxidase
MLEPTWREDGGVQLLRFPFLEQFPGVVAYFTGRAGGISERYPGGLNWSLSVGDDPARVRENRARSLGPTAVGVTGIAIAGLVHGAAVAVVRNPSPLVAECDGLVTDRPGLPLVVTAADCVPVYLVDPEGPSIGLAHAGWRGTAAGVATAALQRMVDAFGSRPERVRAVIGPSIGPCCYEVGEAVAAPVRDRFGTTAQRLLRPVGEPAKWFFDLWEANREELIRAGLPHAQVQVAGVCTSCRVDRLFSHRAERGRAGRGAAVLAMKDSQDGWANPQ